MEANIIKVGNSKGIIIPKKFLKLLGLKEKVKIQIEGEKLLISTVEKKPREGWEEMIAQEVESSAFSEKLMPDFFENEKNDDWKW